MEDLFKKWRKKIRKGFFSETEVSPGSDFPVHEQYTREKDILKINEKKKR